MHWAAGEVIRQKKYCCLHDLNANGFRVTAVWQLDVWEANCEVGTIVQSGYCHVIPRFDTHDEAMKLVTHHHSYPLLCFQLQPLDILTHSLLVRDVVTF